MGGVAWSEEEDQLLRKCIEQYGEGKWHRIPLLAGINRCRKSCRLRWLNYLRPNIKRGKFTDEEVELIIKLHNLLGNRWSLIAGRLPGRTANDVKNYWHCHLSKKLNNSHVANSKPNATSKNTIDQEQMIGETLMSSTNNNNDHGKRDSQAKDNQDEHGSSNGIVACVKGHSYEDCSNINVAQHKEIRFSCEENKLFEDLLPTIDLDFDLEEIKNTGADPRKCSWDFDDLLFDMEI